MGIIKEQVLNLLGDKLNELDVFIDDIYLEKEGKTNYLRVVIDSSTMIDIERVVAATKIIDPIIEKANLVNDEYILDIYAKSKGDD